VLSIIPTDFLGVASLLGKGERPDQVKGSKLGEFFSRLGQVRISLVLENLTGRQAS
jgi:hypothetical protein